MAIKHPLAEDAQLTDAVKSIIDHVVHEPNAMNIWRKKTIAY